MAIATAATAMTVAGTLVLSACLRMNRYSGRDCGSVGFGIALITVNLVLSGCTASPTPECAQASKAFEEALPSMTAVHLASGDALPAIGAGVVLAVVEGLPDDGQRRRCYDEIMRARFYGYPPYATVR
jgi:hypothetical protein